MSDLLYKLLNVLPEAQKTAIKALIDQKKKTGETPSLRSQQEQLATLYSRLKDKLGKKLLQPRYAVKDSKLSSQDHNRNMEEIYLDLNALYKGIDQIGKQDKQQSVVLTSEYEKSKAAVHKLINDVVVFSLRKKYPEFNEVKAIDFNINSNKSNKLPTADINPKTRLLQSKVIYFTRAHLTARGSRHTKVYTKTYAKGIKGTLSKTFVPDLMVDQHPETFWGTMVMSDVPINQIYEISTRNGTSVTTAVNGPVTEIYIQFSHIEQVNTIRYLPFAEYPVTVLDVSYRASPSSQVFYQIKDFYQATTLDWEELNFDSVYAHEIKIVVSQENYKKVIYHLPKHLAVNTNLFQHIFNKAKENVITNSEVPDSDTMLDILKTVSSYTEALAELEEVFVSSGTDSNLYPESKYYEDISNIINEVYSNLDPSIISRVTKTSSLFTDKQNELVEINKYEYILGMREVEIGFTLYAPTSHYSSDKYDTQATISEVSVEVDERHTPFTTQWETDYRKTSVEWSIDLGEGRILPIHPRNIVDEIDQIPAVKDERVWFDVGQNYTYTRLGGYYSSIYRLKKDGNLIPSTEYVVTKITGGSPKLKITLNTGWLDNSIYTVDYAVDPSSYSIQILDQFDSQPLLTPEIFTSVGSDNEIQLTKYPFINYEVVNLADHFSKDQNNDWVFNPTQENINSGQLRITPTIIDDQGQTLQTGSIYAYTISGVWGTRSGEAYLQLTGNSGLSSSYFGDIDGVSFGYFLKIMDSSSFVEVDQFLSASGLQLKSPFIATTTQLQRWDANQTGTVFVGDIQTNISGYLQVDYTIGIGVKTDDQIFALSDNKYSPLLVTVGGVVAKNITNYETLQHPSFSIAGRKDNEYQYIQAGRKVYFNQPIIGKEIKVMYNWVSNYISLLGTLRCNKIANPDLTPKVNKIRILINNLVI